jgi:hypothetical protein
MIHGAVKPPWARFCFCGTLRRSLCATVSVGMLATDPWKNGPSEMWTFVISQAIW